MWKLEEIWEVSKDWPLGTLLVILLFVLFVLLVGLVGYGIYWGVDSLGRPVIGGYGQITEKQFTPAHMQTTTVYNSALKISTPIITHIPDNWEIYVKINGNVGSISVSKNTYEAAKIKQDVFVRFKTGRINKSNVYLTKIILN